MDYDVITICLNSERYIARAINSVLKQKQNPVRYIFVDGGSSDRTLDIIQASISNNPEVDWLLLHQKGRGIANAWNTALKRVKSELICILNSDDWYESDTMGTVLNIFRENPHAHIVAGAVRLYPKETRNQPRILGVRPMALIPFLMPIMHPACFIKRRVYEEIGGFDESYLLSADYDFIYRCYRSRVPIVVYKRPLTNMQAGGLAMENRKKARRETLQIARRNCPVGILPYLAYIIRLGLNR